jgi:GT2 family glycosyltransferase
VLNYWLYHSLLAGGLKQARKRLSLEPATGFKGIRRAGWVMGSAMMIPREAWEAVGGFGENYFLYAEDTDLCYRLAQAGFEILFTPEVTITHSQGEPPPEKRDVAALRLFNGIRTFLRQHYRPTRRRAVESCIVCDMLVRIGLFSIPGVGGPDSVLRRKRLEGYRKILRLYLKGSVDQ